MTSTWFAIQPEKKCPKEGFEPGTPTTNLEHTRPLDRSQFVVFYKFCKCIYKSCSASKTTKQALKETMFVRATRPAERSRALIFRLWFKTDRPATFIIFQLNYNSIGVLERVTPIIVHRSLLMIVNKEI